MMPAPPSDRRALLAELLRRRAESPQVPFPLSPGQQGLWFLCRNTPEDPAYNVAFAARSTTTLDIDVLRRSLEALVRRHPSLRTIFREQEGQPVQEVLSTQPLHFEQVPVQGQDEETLRRSATAALKRPFDLERGPLLRVTLFSRSPSEHILLLAMHHLVCDGWSYWLMLDELVRLYAAGGDELSAGLTPLAHTYEDFVRWKAGQLAGPEGERLWSYWRQQLALPLPELQLPSDRPRRPDSLREGASIDFTLSPELSQSLRALARAEGTTLYTLLLAAFQVLLSRWSGQRDLLVGSPVTGEGRARAELSNVVGFMIDTLVLRCQLEPGQDFRSHLSRTRETVLGALDHQGFPLPLLTERLRPQRAGTPTSLFQVLFLLHRPQQFEEALSLLAPGAAAARVDAAGLVLEPFEIPQQENQFELCLELWDAPSALSGTFKYDTRLFDRATLDRMIGHFRTLLESIVAQPGTSVDALALLPQEERQRLLTEWNAGGEPFLGTACLHELFVAQARRTPQAIAAVSGRERLTYAELDKRSTQLAGRLRALGAGPEERIGVCLRRDTGLVTALLAILKAGAAYVPLDPAYPAERLRFTLEDAGARLTLTQSAYASLLRGTASRLIELDSEDWEAAGPDATPLPSGLSPSHLAYVIYTSGSTGRPKGVAIEHRSVVAFLDWAARVFPAEQRAGILASTSVCFDLSVFELFLPLATGGKVILADNALALPSLENASEITLINTVPSAMAELLADRGLPASVKTVNLAGEALHRSLVEDLYARTQAERVYNLYGPTEDTTYSTFALIERGQATPPAIGRPIQYTRAYVLDHLLHPVPIGVPGELYLGGSGLARGYLGRPELTAQRFIPDPFSSEPGARLYRTGDLTRYRGDGTLEYLGRIDHQVKIRGFRIEPGEIEQVASPFPGLGQIAVMAETGAGGEPRLVAYVVPAAGHTVSLPGLRTFLKERLPAHFIPSLLVPLEEMPRTPNGKIDRRALRAPEHPTEDPALQARPQGPLEELLASLLGELLGVSALGRHTDFFEQGGHSLLVARAISRIRKSLGRELPMRALFDFPTPAGLARHLETLRSVGRSLPPPRRLERTPDAPLSSAQRRLWFLHQLNAGPVYHMPFALRLTGPLDAAVLERCVARLVKRHEILRTCFPESGGVPVQRLQSGPGFIFQHVEGEALGLTSTEAEREWLEQEARRPFELTTGPLFRVTLVRHTDHEWLLLFVLHHLIADGESMRVMAEELSQDYAAALAGQEAERPELAFQYSDHAHWQRQCQDSPAIQQGLDFWRTQLRDAPLALELPTSHARPAVQTFQGRQYSFTLERELGDALGRLARSSHVTPYMALLSAFAILLSRYSGQEDLIIGSPSAGHRAEFEPMMGLFVNLLPLRLRLSGDPSFGALLASTRTIALDAYTHQEVPFEQIVEALGVPRSVDRSPLFQVAFSVQDALERSLRLPGLRVRPLNVDPGTSRFELSLVFEEHDGQWKGTFEYNSALFEASFIQRMAEHLRVLLQGAVDAPDARISELPLLSRAERHQVLVERNLEKHELPEPALVHHLIEAQVLRTPDALAVAFQDEVLTYQQLDSRANRLANALRRQGVGPDVIVALGLERSTELVVAMLATLKAGGAWLPLEPSLPLERLGALISDARPRVFLTHSRAPRPSLPAGTYVIVLDEQRALMEEGPEESPRVELDGEHLAYVIYTSGSTGRPKGTLLRHRGLCNTALQIASAMALHPCSRVLQFASASFDASVWEIFPTLMVGASVHLAPREELIPGEALHEVLRRRSITAAILTPSVLAQLDPRGLETLETLASGGEACTPELVERWRTGPRFLNAYGPTEVTICSSIAMHVEPERITLGRPFHNVQGYVLDTRLRPVPVGVPGELYIGGEGLARGYLGRPELTAERFIPHPFSNEPGARLYRTGDKARWQENGELEYLGRTDFQVKLRGYRIEPGEIESWLLDHPGIREAVVVRSGSAGQERLVAYVVARASAGTARPGLADLRAHLRTNLPEYMIPSAFCFLDALPLSPSGKLDRRALPPPSSAPSDSEAAPVLPQTELERRITAIWKDVLRLEQVGIHDNFFDLGGHSLLLANLRTQLRQQLSVEVSMIDLFQYTTIHALAGLLGSRHEASADEAPHAPESRGPRRELARRQRELRVGQRSRPDSGGKP
ncbi:non-ribosomal peptide synthetase [Hyalangium versicolor]|uniref:non-ribosomal peptide synthetase n=1 Tax=Hyalangium versicolor TaxID=2861190 RepID=UPI001CCD2578|nr:non-ribosomal peptide synthetase [Hyalangium versicolor]